MCESHDGFIWTKGDDSQAPGCGTCWCCQPNGNQKLFNKHKIICNSTSSFYRDERNPDGKNFYIVFWETCNFFWSDKISFLSFWCLQHSLVGCNLLRWYFTQENFLARKNVFIVSCTSLFQWRNLNLDFTQMHAFSRF